ncbi:MAG: hypothetical protein KGL15_05725 [Acidobacteriota bacterium]|nr:hypothetical protein [Acidobacteriota bacterium]
MSPLGTLGGPLGGPLGGSLGGPLGGSLGGSLGGPLGGVDPIGGSLSGTLSNTAGLVLQAVSSWVLDATRSAIEEVAGMIGRATAPNLDGTWFSATYWRVAALAAMLTLPFLCAAAVQAVARADLSLLARVAFGYLPLAILGVSLAAPLTKLLLAATDQMSAAVSASAATGGARFLDLAAHAAGAMAVATGGSPFFAVVVGLLAVLAALALAIELLVRAAAVYVVVLMLPLAFAALVWPARRVWAARLVELLASLILSKFVIVAVLSLAGAAFAGGTPGINQLLVAMSLITLATFAPWALMRILPFTELAAGAAGILRSELPHAGTPRALADKHANRAASELAAGLPARLREQARSADAATGGETELAHYATPHFEEPTEGSAATDADQGRAGTVSVPSDTRGPSHASVPAAESEPADAGAATEASVPADAGAATDASVPADAGADASSRYVLPHAWRGRERARLTDQALRPPTPAQGPHEEQS